MERWREVDEYIRELFDLEDDALRAAVRTSAAAGLPGIQVSAVIGRLLNVLATSVGARRILEIGTLGGYSTIWLSRALPHDGELVSLEIDPHHADVARASIARSGLEGVAKVVVGPASESLARLATAGGTPFDFVFIDADKEGYPDYLEWSIRLSRPGALIVADNVIRQGQVAEPGNPDPRVQAVRLFNERLAADDRLTATLIQTVGAKSYDGLAIAVVNGSSQ